MLTKVFVGFALILLASCSRWGLPTSTLAPKQMSPKLIQSNKRAFQLFQEGKSELALQAYLETVDLAKAEENVELTIQLLTNAASCYYSMARYSSALAMYQQALLEARKNRLSGLEALIATNKASLFLSLGQDDHAKESLEGIADSGQSLPPAFRLDYFLVQAIVSTRLHQHERAAHFFRQALMESEKPLPAAKQGAGGNTQRSRELRRARTMDSIAETLMLSGSFDSAEPLLQESFRIRSTFGDNSRYFNALHLARIARERGDLQNARQLLQIARLMEAESPVHLHKFLLHREWALLQIEEGNLEDAPSAIQIAKRAVASWRTEVLPQNAAYVNFEAFLNTELQQKFASVLVRPGVNLRSRQLAEESFWLAEEARFASMRSAQFPNLQLRERLPDRYWKGLAELQGLRAALLNGQSGSRERVRKLEMEMEQLELNAGLAMPRLTENSEVAFRYWQQSIPKDEALFSFYLSEPSSLAWMVTRNSIELRRIPGKKQLALSVRCFLQNLKNPSQSETQCSGLNIYDNLFGEFSSSSRTIPYWTVVLDGELFEVPLSALRLPGGRYLIEDHVLRILPSALYLKELKTEEGRRMAIGLADPIYNLADSRLQPGANRNSLSRTVSFTLNRLPGSATELESCWANLRRKSWKTQSFLDGGASIANLRSALESSPDILHVASHVVSNAKDNSHVALALSLEPGTPQPSLFGALDFNTIRTKTKLMVLSGCHSSNGEPISGLGINSLSRAALVSGVRNVIATLWPVDDSAGPLFQSMYQELPDGSWNSRSVAESLRRAQLKMLRRGDWFSQPAYWAAYIAISRG